MTYQSIYCQALHNDSPDGCYEFVGHTGKHRGISGAGEFYWGDETLEGVSPAFTQAEVGILLTALQPIQQFFPELVKKLELMGAQT